MVAALTERINVGPHRPCPPAGHCLSRPLCIACLVMGCLCTACLGCSAPLHIALLSMAYLGMTCR